MNNVYLFIAVVVLAVLLGVTVKGSMEKSDKIKELEDSITAFNKAQTETVKTVTKIEKVMVEKKSDCYWQQIEPEVLSLIRGK